MALRSVCGIAGRDAKNTGKSWCHVAHADAATDHLKLLSRRGLLSSGVLASVAMPSCALGVEQGRVPGLPNADEDSDGDGWVTYLRPAEKEGNHGVGWSPPPQVKTMLA